MGCHRNQIHRGWERLNATIEAGKEYEVTVVVDEKGLDDAIGIESVIIRHEAVRITYMR